MRIEQLQAFLAIAETGNFSQAAQQCGVTQSTISRQIQSLESDLGMPLFHRSSKAKLTLSGEELLPRARKICGEWQTALQEIASIKAGKQPELCVAAIHSVCAYYLPPVLQSFCRDFPDVQLRVTALGSDRALKVLRDGLVDVAIVMNNRFLTSSAEIVTEVLYEEPIEILMAKDHPLSKFEAVPCSEVVRYPQVVFKDGYGMQRLIMDWFNRQGATLRSLMELNTLDAFRGVVRQGEIVAMLPRSALADCQDDQTLTIRPLALTADERTASPLTRQVVMVTTSDRLDIPPIAHFCQLVKKRLKSPKVLQVTKAATLTSVLSAVGN